MATVPSFCRNCLAYCPVLVEVENGRATRVTGDPAAAPYGGYTCPKGRALPAQHNDPQRLLHPLRRGEGDAFSRLAPADAVGEVAARLRAILDAHGPRAVAMYTGTGIVSHPEGPSVAKALFRALGSPMVFSAATIDKPAANISTALHGNWEAGAQPFETADVWLIVGANPLIAKSNGLPCNNPGERLTQALRRGLQLIVIDPRRSETARRARFHLQARPGTDPEVLAGLIRVLFEEGLVDHAFIGTHARGAEALRVAVDPFTAERVEQRTGVPAAMLLAAARAFGRGPRGGAVCSTGPSFATRSNLSYYLALCLNTLCGRWAREGDEAPYPNVLLPAYTPRAQPYPPYPVFGKQQMRGLGLRENASGMPTAALADEILLEGPERVRALFCLGGNPLMAWPDHARTLRAMRALDLLVVLDYRMTATARLAHYVVPPPLSLELPGTTQFSEALKYNGVSRGFDMPWAQYTPAVATPPSGAELMDDGEFFFRLAQQLGLRLEWTNVRGYGPHLEQPKESIPFDMARVPTTDDLIALMARGSRVPLEDVRRHPGGRVFDEVRTRVAPRSPDCSARLELADPLMLAELAAAAAPVPGDDDRFPYRLACRRANRAMNSVGDPAAAMPESPAVFLHSADANALGLAPGDPAHVRSFHGEVLAVVRIDDHLLPGVVSMVHGQGEPADPACVSSVTRLVGLDEHDPVSGIPRMTGIPVALSRAAG